MKAPTFATLALAFTGLAVSQSTTTTTSSTSATITGVPKPSPTQDGLIGSCTSFYKAVLGDTCIGIVNKNNGAFTLAQFVSWNPAVGNDCLGLWANTYYCVGVAGTSTTTLSTSTSSSTQGNGISTPVPTQPGMVGNCELFYFVKAGDTCQKIAQYYGVLESDVINWNPSVGPSCRGLWADVNVCVRTVGYNYLVTSLVCSSATDTKTWGDNKPAALESVAQWCSSEAPGIYAIDEKKSACFNAPLGQNKFSFEITNKSGRRLGLTPGVCNILTKEPINRCARGGSALYRSWEIKASVTAGRC